MTNHVQTLENDSLKCKCFHFFKTILIMWSYWVQIQLPTQKSIACWVPCPTTMDHPSLLGTMSDNHGPPQLVGYHAWQPWTTPAYWVPCPTTMDHPSLLSTMSDNHGPPQLIGYHVRHPWTTPAYWVPCPTTMDHPSPGCPDLPCRRSAV